MAARAGADLRAAGELLAPATCAWWRDYRLHDVFWLREHLHLSALSRAVAAVLALAEPDQPALSGLSGRFLRHPVDGAALRPLRAALRDRRLARADDFGEPLHLPRHAH